MVHAPLRQEAAVSLQALVEAIHHYDAIIQEWDEAQRATVAGLRRAIETLHREALVRLIRRVKQESLLAMRYAAEDEVVYSLLRYYDLVKPQQPPLEQRLQQALAEVRPGLQSHNGDVELVAFHPPDRVELRLTGTCSHCPASQLTLSEGVEQTIKRYCPEIQTVIAVNGASPLFGGDLSTPSFPAIRGPEWLEVTALAEVPSNGVLAMKLDGKAIVLTRIDTEVLCYHNACSHLGMPLDSGSVEQTRLSCPYHGFQYCLKTGECLTTPGMSLPSYPVRVQDGRVFVRLSDER